MGKVIQIEVPEGLEEEFIKTLKELIEVVRVSLMTEIIEKSELSEEQAKNLAEEIKIGMAKRHILTKDL